MLLVSIFLSHLNIDVALLKQWPPLTVVCDDDNPRIDDQKVHCLLYVNNCNYFFPKGHNIFPLNVSDFSPYFRSPIRCVKRGSMLQCKNHHISLVLYIYLAFQAKRFHLNQRNQVAWKDHISLAYLLNWKHTAADRMWSMEILVIFCTVT